MKGCTFPKAPASFEPHHPLNLTCLASCQDTRCRGAVVVFYSPSRLGNQPFFRTQLNSYTYDLLLMIVGLAWFDLVLWHINQCRLFNAKSFLYIYLKYTWFDLIVFYGISTIVGYLMPNPFYTYILNIHGLV